MLVDDSAIIRGAVAQLLEDDPSIKIIASVANGELAVQAATRYKPDIVILDVEMPVMDGMTALPLILKESPRSKVIMFSTLTERGADITIKALSLGAVECLVKPTAGRGMKGGEFHSYLLNVIRNLKPRRTPTPVSTIPAAPVAATPASSATSRISTTSSSGAASYTPASTPSSATTVTRPAIGIQRPMILAIGSSTGGPQALFEVLKHCRNLRVPIVITQHMPPTFTKILADHITRQCDLPTFEAEDGMIIQPGKAYVAKGGFHMLITKHENGSPMIKLDNGPAVNYCKPAVDPMLDSLIAIYGAKILSVILTGMGHDGLDGCKKLVALGGQVIAQDEATSVVWGMPGAVAQAGICSEILPLSEIGTTIKRIIS